MWSFWRSAVIIHGEKAHSRYMGEDAFKLLKGDNKEVYDKMKAFFKENLK